MEGSSEFDLETWVQGGVIDTSRSFSSPRRCDRSHMTRIPLDETSTVVQESNKTAHPSKHNSISEGEHLKNTDVSSWNISTVLCGDDSSEFQKGIYCSSGLSDGAARGFYFPLNRMQVLASFCSILLLVTPKNYLFFFLLYPSLSNYFLSFKFQFSSFLFFSFLVLAIFRNFPDCSKSKL